MEKLELKHLAPYLPYGLKVIIPYHQEKGIMNLSKLSKYKCWLDNGGSIHLWQEQYIDKIKPILRPLSDLTKEIEHNGERFVPKELLREISGAFKPTDDIKNTFNICIVDGTVTRFSALCVHVNQLELFQKLFEWHFDVFGLIDKGLAIDINNLK